MQVAEPLFDQAIAHYQSDRLPAAESLLHRVIAKDPANTDALHLLAIINHRLGRPDAAIELLERAVAISPTAPPYHTALGLILASVGRLDEAMSCHRQAIALEPGNADAHNNLGYVLHDSGRYDEAIAAHKHAVVLRPQFAAAWHNLGISLQQLGKLDEAIGAYRKAIALQPDFSKAYHNLANALKDSGDLDEAISTCRKALALSPNAFTGGNLLYLIHFHPDYDARRIYEEHVQWNDTYAVPLGKNVAPHNNDRSPGRRLRIGYVSPDLREHVVGRFMLPILENHDKQNFEIFCYADIARVDEMSHRLRSHVDTWRETSRLSDEQLAQTIRSDCIDILVDLTMHIRGGRLLTFARKPAPVQVTYLAYCSTTGLRAMDYRLTDPYLDPPGIDESLYSERSVRLLETYWCYQPAGEPLDVRALPAQTRGHITFGCLNNFCKVSSSTIETWSEILRKVGGARLIIYAAEGSHRQRVLRQMASGGVNSDRIEFVGRLVLEKYLEKYHQIDIALDPFPYTGGTTTCDALWMGVPVVSIAGQTAVSRGGLSILSNIGLAELCARSRDEYVHIAVELSKDMGRLGTMRSSLRERMSNSPLMNAPRFTRGIEDAFRKMWREWYQTKHQTP